MGRRIALVGTCPSSRMLAPYREYDVEIWACSPDNAGVLPRVTRWFDPHDDLGLPDGQPWERSYIDWVNAQPFEVVAQDLRLFPSATRLPKDEIVERFGRLFISSTPAWMMLYAMMLGDVSEIGLFGLDMSSRHEYLVQRPGFHHWIEIAEKQFGIAVYAPLESDILQPGPIYGYSYNTPYGRKLEVRRKELAGRIAEIDRTVAQANRDRAFLEGAMDDIDYMQSIWTGERDPAQGEAVPLARSPKVVNLKGD